jgi:uncharacterized membrane protein YiaA
MQNREPWNSFPQTFFGGAFTAPPPTAAFIGASWIALFIGFLAYLTGLWNSDMQLNERGYYFAVLINGLFAAVSLQKSVRDRQQGIPVTGTYFGLCWLALGISLLLIAVGLWNATLTRSEKGFYGMSFTLCLFAAVAVQKNVRDMAQSSGKPKEMERELVREEQSARPPRVQRPTPEVAVPNK